MVENVEDDGEDSEDDGNDEMITFSVEDYGDYILNELDNIGKRDTYIAVIGANNAINWPSGERKRNGSCLPTVRDCIPTDEEFDLIKEVMKKLRKVESVSKALQREVRDGGELELDLFQTIFDHRNQH